jgi:3',5'-cyclic AMP phosphodiesterase CpdA
MKFVTSGRSLLAAAMGVFAGSATAADVASCESGANLDGNRSYKASLLHIRLIAALTFLALLVGCADNGAPNGENATAGQTKKFAQCANFASDAFVSREELAPVRLKSTSELMLRMVHMSDTHITDDDGQFTNGASVIDPAYPSAQRLHEEYSDEILNDFIRVMNECDKQYKSEFVVITGDVTDLTTIAETRRVIDNFDGTFDAASAFEESCETGLGEGAPDEVYQQLCVRHTGKGVADTESEMPNPDSPMYEFQVTRTLQQLLDTEVAAATGRWADGSTDPDRQTLTRSPGLPEPMRCNWGDKGCNNEHFEIPWMAAFGNHDGYIRGTVAGDLGFNEASQLTGRHFMIHQHEFIDEFFFTKAFPGPIGHGFNFADEARQLDENQRNDGYYGFDAGEGQFRMLVLNTMFDGIDDRLPTDAVRNPLAVASGWMDSEQFAWLKKELAEAYAAKQMVFVWSHHPDYSFAGATAETFQSNVTAEALNAELASWPNMVAWMAGHTHRHNIRPFSVQDGVGTNDRFSVNVECKVPGQCRGYWQIETASMLDHPQEQRMVEVYDNGDGTGTLRSPVFGHGLESFKKLAAVDRGCTFFPLGAEDVTTALEQLAAGSGCLGGGVAQGNPKDRNVELGFTLPLF